MKDLTSAKLIYVKGLLFVVIGLICATLLIVQNPTLKTAALLAVAVWSFCRAYYLAFYVIEKYVDSKFRFSGLFSFVRYLMSRDCRTNATMQTSDTKTTIRIM